MDITIQQILQARDRRAERQKTLLNRFNRPLICFTMNIAGPEKCNDLVKWGFELGDRLLSAQLCNLGVMHREVYIEPTGCEGYYVVDAAAQELKRRTVQVEDYGPVARLFDMDVLDIAGNKLERTALGFPGRKCLLCENPAHLCGRSRSHTVEQLQDKTKQLIRDAMTQEDARHIGQIAQQSLLYEVCTTPKPGLVDCANSGSHQDMDIFTFMASGAALADYFKECAKIGIDSRHLDTEKVLPLLRFPGKLAEQAMYQATGGVNTHKGCIFSLGILCAVAGRLEANQRTPENILALCKEVTKGITRELNKDKAATVGENLFAQHGITGVRGQAEAGFPAVLSVGLPTLEKGLEKGLSLNDSGCAALLAILACTADTNLIHRSNLQQQQAVSAQIAELRKTHPFPSKEVLEELDRQFIEKNLSPGGSADLLALTYFLHFLCNDKTPCNI